MIDAFSLILMSNILIEIKSNGPDQHLLEIEEAQNNKTTKYLNKSIDLKSIYFSMTYYRSHI